MRFGVAALASGAFESPPWLPSSFSRPRYQAQTGQKGDTLMLHRGVTEHQRAIETHLLSISRPLLYRANTIYPVRNLECCWALCATTVSATCFSCVIAEAQAFDDVATAFDLEDSDEDAQLKMDELRRAKLVEIPTEASVVRDDQTQPMEMIVAVPEVDSGASSNCSRRGGRGGQAWTANRTQKPCFCCELMAVRSQCFCQVHKRTWMLCSDN